MLKSIARGAAISKITVLCLLYSICGGSLSADVVHLKNGNTIEGVIAEKGEDALKIKVKIGMITFPADDIESVEESGAQENQALERKWQEEDINRQAENAQELEKEQVSEYYFSRFKRREDRRYRRLSRAKTIRGTNEEICRLATPFLLYNP